MRARFAAVLASIAVHVTAIVVLASREAPAHVARRMAVAEPPVDPVMVVELAVEPAPIVVETPVPSRASVASRGGASSPRPARVASIEQRVPTGAAATESSGTPSALGMRGSDGLRPQHRPALVADLHVEEREAPPPPPEIGDTAHANDARILELSVKLANPSFYKLSSDESIERAMFELESLEGEREALRLDPAGGGRYKNNRETFETIVERDGTVHIADKPNIHVKGPVVVFDVTDAIMRARGTDPYAPAKLRFLDKTRDERAELGRRYRAEQLARSPELAVRNLERAWALPDLAARKQALFELWDDCAETGDAALVEAGQAARNVILGEIRARLGADAYTADELARLNAHRHSTQLFAP